MRRWQLWIGLVISLFFLIWAFRQVGSFSEIGTALVSADYRLVILALIPYFFGVWLRAARWQLLLAPMKTMSTRKLFQIVVIGYMANDVLPARMGEIVRAYVLNEREGISKSATLATIFLERLFDGIILILFGAIVSLLTPFTEELQGLVRGAALVFAAAGATLAFLALLPAGANAFLSVVFRALPQGLRLHAGEMAESFLGGLQALQQGKLVLRVMALTIAAWLCEAAMYYIVGLGFQISRPFQVFVLTAAIANLGTMIPSSPGYIGTFEALSLFTLRLFGVSSSLAMSFALVLHAALLVPVTLLGFYYLWLHHLPLVLTGRGAITADSSTGPKRGGLDA